MSELNVLNNMEQEVLRGIDNGASRERFWDIKSFSENEENQIETSNAKTGVSDVVKKLEKETREMFANKEDVAKVEVTQPTDIALKTKEKIPTTERRILGMTPVVFGVVVVLAAVGSYFAYKNYKGKLVKLVKDI